MCARLHNVSADEKRGVAGRFGEGWREGRRERVVDDEEERKKERGKEKRRRRERDHSRIIIIVGRIEPVVYEICSGLRVAATRNDCVRMERSLGNAASHPGNQQQMLPRVYVFSPIVVFGFHTRFMAASLFLRRSR